MATQRKQRRSPWQHENPVLERLEARRLLAGNVAATLLPDGTLLLKGDDLPNEIMLRTGQAPDEVIVHGMNQTFVNGTNQDWVFPGVQRIVAEFHGGDDWFKTTDLTLAAKALGELVIDGGNGDDRIELKNTEVHAAQSSGVSIFGDRSLVKTDPTKTPNTGNDTIQLSNTRIIAEGISNRASVSIYGDFNLGGEVAGGSDTITLTDTFVSATNGLKLNSAFVEVFGDFNSDAAKLPSKVGEGNDFISVTNTTISTAGVTADNAAFLRIVGDANQTIGLNTSTVVGGNDSISVTNTAVASTGEIFTNSAFLLIEGDFNQAAEKLAGTGGTAAVGGGNDSITLDAVTVSAIGGTHSNSAIARVLGDHNQFVGSGAIELTVKGGNDSISVNNVEVVAAGGTKANGAILEIYGDLNTDLKAVAGRVGQGNDDIAISNSVITATGAGFDQASVKVVGDASLKDTSVGEGRDKVVMRHVQVSGDLDDVSIDTSIGDDTLDVQNSSFDKFSALLGSGNDYAKFLANTFLSAHLDGGDGFDVLDAHNNVGALTFSNFEETNVTP